MNMIETEEDILEYLGYTYNYSSRGSQTSTSTLDPMKVISYLYRIQEKGSKSVLPQFF